MPLPWRRDKSDLRTLVAEYIYAKLNINKENPDKDTLKLVGKHNKSGNTPLSIKIVVFVPLWIPEGKEKGHWVNCKNKITDAFRHKDYYNAGGWTEYKADGYYEMDGKIVKDRHMVIEVSIASSNLDDIAIWLKGDIRRLQEGLVQDSIWLVINDCPPIDGYSAVSKYDKKEWKLGQGAHDTYPDEDAYPVEIHAHPPEAEPPIPVQNITNTGQKITIGTQIGTQHITNIFSQPETSVSQSKTPGELYRSGLELFQNDKPEQAYEKFYQAWKMASGATEPHLVEVCKRSAQQALMCLKGRPELATENDRRQLKDTYLRLSRDKEIPDFEGLNDLIKSFSDHTNFLHHEDQLDYLDFIGEKIDKLDEINLDTTSKAVSRKQIKDFRAELNATLGKSFPEIHDQAYTNAEKYYKIAKQVITIRWQEYIKDQPMLFPDNLRTGSSFSLNTLLEHHEFANIKASLNKNTSWQSTDNLDISRFVECRSKLFDAMDGSNFGRLNERTLSAEELRNDLRSVLLALSANREDLINNLSEIIRFCSRTDTMALSENKNLIAVVFERHGGDKKPWHIISKYDHFKNRIDSLAWGEYIESTSKAHGKKGNTLDLMEEWLYSRYVILEIEGIGGLGKTASVLEFIRRLGVFGNKQEYLSHDMFFLTAKSEDQGEHEVDSEARSRDYKLRNPRNYDLGIGEYLKELKFEDVLLRINQLYENKFGRNHGLNEDELRNRVVSNLQEKKAMIFLDNFEDVSKEERMKYAKFFEKLPPTVRVIITSRPGGGDIGPSYKMKLDMLGRRASSELFEARYQKLHSKSSNSISAHLTQIRAIKNEGRNIIEELIDKVPKGKEYEDKKDAIRQGSSHPLVIFYMVSMSLNNRPKQADMKFIDHLLDLSLDPEKGFDKAQRDWQSWVITKSYGSLGKHALEILKALADFGGTADDNDLIETLNMDTDDYNQGVSQLTMQEIFIEQSTEQQGLFLRKTAQPFLKEKGITINQKFGGESADTTKNRVERLESILDELQTNGPSSALEFDTVDDVINLKAEQRGGVDLSLLGIVVEICSRLQGTTYYSKWNGFLKDALDYYSGNLKSQSPEKLRHLIDLFVRAAISRIHNKELFTATLLEIYNLDRAPGLGETTRDQLRELIENEDNSFVFDIETYESIDHIRVWLAILDSIMLEISHKKNLQTKLILFILELHASPYRLDDLDVKFIKNVLNISRDAIDWNVQYDILHDLYTDARIDFQINELDDIPRYTRYDPQRIAMEDLRSVNLKFQDPLNSEVSPDDLGPHVLLSFDKKDYFSNVYLFRVVLNPTFSPPHESEDSPMNASEVGNARNVNMDSSSRNNPTMDFDEIYEDHVLPKLSDWKPLSVDKKSSKIKDEDLVKFLTNPSNWNHNKQISRKVLESKFGKISRDQIDDVIDYINSSDENTVRIEIEAKGNPYTERYEMSIPLEHNKRALDKFIVEWFEDQKEGKTNYYCRGMPMEVKTVTDLFNGYLPQIRDNVRSTTSQRPIDFANEILKSLNTAGNIGPKTSFIWYCAFHVYKNFLNITDLAVLRCKLIPHLAREQHRRLAREDLQPAITAQIKNRCREWEDELISINCTHETQVVDSSQGPFSEPNLTLARIATESTARTKLKDYSVYDKNERQMLFEVAYTIQKENGADYRIQKAWVSFETRDAIFKKRGILSIGEFMNRLANFDRLMK